MGPMSYPWYNVVGGPDIEQGDMLFDLDVPEVGNPNEDAVPVTVQTYDEVDPKNWTGS